MCIRDRLAGPLFEDKVIDYIVELANVTDFEINIDALYEPEIVGNSSEAKKPAQKAAKKPSAKKTAKKAAKKAAKAKSEKDETGSDVAVVKKKPSAKKAAKKAAARKS